MRSTAFGLLVTLLASIASAAEPDDLQARKSGVFTVYLENDSFANRDLHYTSGLKVSWLSADLTEWGRRGWQKGFTEMLPFVNRAGSHKNIGLAFGQNIYTPRDIDREVPDPADRPYAGWSYLEFMFVSKTMTRMDTLAFQIGMIGRYSYAQDVQTTIHRWIESRRPAGWAHQLANEVGANIVYERKWRTSARALQNTLGIDIVPHAGLSVGNVQSYLNAGVTVRVGFQLPNDFAVGPIRAAAAPSTPLDDTDPRVAPGSGWSLFLFGGLDGRAVARDIFLDGNTFRDGPRVDKETYVGDAYYGVGAGVGKWQLTFTRVFRSREFSGQHEPSHYGSVSISRML